MANNQFDGNIHDKTYSELLEAYRKGGVQKVVDNLARRHPAIAVTFIVQLSHDRSITGSDANIIANRLMEDFIELRDAKGLRATERHDVD